MSASKITSPTKLSTIKQQDQRIVFKLSRPVIMKFRPQKVEEHSSFVNKMVSKLLPFRVSRDTQTSQVSQNSSTLKESPFEELRFLYMLDADSYLVGNKCHADAFSFSMIDDFIETDHLWTLRLKNPIQQLLVDARRRTIITISSGQIQIFGFEGRRSKNPPVLQKSLTINEEVRFIQFAKDMLLAVFFQSSVSFYSIDQANSRQVSKKDYKVNKQLALYQACQCVDGVINLFFTGPRNPQGESQKEVQPEQDEEKQLFGLYWLSIDIAVSNYSVSQPKHIRDTSENYRSTLKVEAINKQCYLINLGKKIIMFKRGYKVDTLEVNLQKENSLLRYFPDRKVVFVAASQVDMYNLIIDLNVNPPKISLKSTDSVLTNISKECSFIDALRFDNTKWGFFYQIPTPNLSGQVRYQFYITMPWDFNEKVNSLLPRVSEFKGQKTDENPNFMKFLQLIKQRCQVVDKMGVSRKEAYLWIWRESKQQTIEEFKLLLDTLDYGTIKNEISGKLKKKMMQLGEVHKMQQGCLTMLGEVLFGQSGFTEEVLKNYMTSHLLVRKLQLFKEIKLYAKQAGKLRLTDMALEKDKLMINIQQYTNSSQMDIKAFLLQMIYNFCKFKNDLVKEIRIVLRKFRVPLRYIYIDLLKDIIANTKEQLLFLLTNIPELLPYTPIPKEGQDPATLKGVWDPLKQQEWDRVLYLGQVVTIFNRQLVLDYSESVWIRRNFLTSHDMIFLSRAQIQEKFKENQQKIFYVFLEQIFDKKAGLEGRLQDLKNYLQDNYEFFPNHLFSNIFLYRQLYLYFLDNKFTTDPFQSFLRLKDDEIFKLIFDHEKFKKGSLLKEIKPLYESLGQGEKFNYGLLKFFSSNLSQVSDIKYLLNRINNQKKQFHAENQEMYEVLIKGMQIKLKLGSDRDIPIEEVLIYLTQIPLKEGNVLQQQKIILQEINKLAHKFKAMKLNMSVFELIRNRDVVLMKAVQHLIATSGIRDKAGLALESIAHASRDYIQQISSIRTSIFGQFADNDILFIYLTTILQNINMAFSVHKIIQQNAIKETPFGQTQLESVVYYCYRKKTIQQPPYPLSEEYLSKLAELLPEGNTLRSFIQSELAVSKLFGSAGLDMVYPISGDDGVIQKRQINGLLDCLTMNNLLELDLLSVQKHFSNMQTIVGLPSPVSLYQIYQKTITCLLSKGRLKDALGYIQKMLDLDESNPNTIIYLTLVFKKISGEFVDQNKQFMLSLITKLWKRPRQILSIYQELVIKALSNDNQKSMLMDKLAGLLSAEASFDTANPLFDPQVVECMAKQPQKLGQFQKLFKYQLAHLIKSNDEFSKSIDFHIFHMFVLQNPILFVNYIHKARYVINVREVRCFLSYLSKYQIFDQFKVLQFSKRLFKVLYDCQKDFLDAGPFIEEEFSRPLHQICNIDILQADNQNLMRLSKAVQKFKGKLKAKMSSSALKKKVGIIKQDKIGVWLSDYNQYAQNYDYPFNDSDGYIDKLQYLETTRFRQPPPKGGIFNEKKYLKWMLIRTDQPISHYLVLENEVEADEQMRKMQQALKTSFSSSPLDRLVHDQKKTIVQVLVRQESAKSNIITSILNLPHVSAIPVVQGSAISENVGEWFQETPQINMASIILKEQLLQTVDRAEDGKLTFKVQILRNYGKGHQLDNVLPECLKQIYHDESTEYITILELFKQIYNFCPKQTSLNSQYLDIYLKIDQLQRKLSLQLPTRQLLPFAGLQLKDKDTVVLFQYLKQLIHPFLNQNNVHTLSRIISLAFKKPDFHQQLNNEFLKVQINEFVELQIESQDQRMKLQKITAFAQKMPLLQLKTEMQRTIESIFDKEKRDQIVRVVIEMLRQKYDHKGADQIQSRWLTTQQ